MPELRGLEVGGINTVIYEHWRNRSPEEVLEYHEQVQAEVMRTLESVPDDYSAEHRVKDIERALDA